MVGARYCSRPSVTMGTGGRGAEQQQRHGGDHAGEREQHAVAGRPRRRTSTRPARRAPAGRRRERGQHGVSTAIPSTAPTPTVFLISPYIPNDVASTSEIQAAGPSRREDHDREAAASPSAPNCTGRRCSPRTSYTENTLTSGLM